MLGIYARGDERNFSCIGMSVSFLVIFLNKSQSFFSTDVVVLSDTPMIAWMPCPTIAIIAVFTKIPGHPV